MRYFRHILLVLLSAILITGCRSSSVLKKQQVQHDSSKLIRTLLEEPAVDELTASLSLNINDTKVSGQIRMRRGHSIQISASMLGLVEVARIEFLPEMVVVMDKFHNLYSVCHYADIPYRNELGLDFEVVQALFWNRVFSPGSSGVADAESRLQVQETIDRNTIVIKDLERGYLFSADGTNQLNSVAKQGTGYSFSIDYSEFTAVSGKWRYPFEMSVGIDLSESRLNASIKMSSVSVERKNWPDRTQVSRRMKQVSLEELLDNIDL